MISLKLQWNIKGLKNIANIVYQVYELHENVRINNKLVIILQKSKKAKRIFTEALFDHFLKFNVKALLSILLNYSFLLYE